ncbi:MAG: hypothetical protein HY908_21295 [Myxococcales bacterium]|nr:hypothetical protein [Myxococcales bacterium]
MSATRADPPADDPTAPLTRAAGRQLARLWSSRPGELPAPAPLEPRDLARLRDILGALAAELEHPDAGSARRIDAAWAALGGAAIRAPRTVAGEDVPLPPLPPPHTPCQLPRPHSRPRPPPPPRPHSHPRAPHPG